MGQHSWTNSPHTSTYASLLHAWQPEAIANKIVLYRTRHSKDGAKSCNDSCGEVWIFERTWMRCGITIPCVSCIGLNAVLGTGRTTSSSRVEIFSGSRSSAVWAVRRGFSKSKRRHKESELVNLMKQGTMETQALKKGVSATPQEGYFSFVRSLFSWDEVYQTPQKTMVGNTYTASISFNLKMIMIGCSLSQIWGQT